MSLIFFPQKIAFLSFADDYAAFVARSYGASLLGSAVTALFSHSLPNMLPCKRSAGKLESQEGWGFGEELTRVEEASLFFTGHLLGGGDFILLIPFDSHWFHDLSCPVCLVQFPVSYGWAIDNNDGLGLDRGTFISLWWLLHLVQDYWRSSGSICQTVKETAGPFVKVSLDQLLLDQIRLDRLDR